MEHSVTGDVVVCDSYNTVQSLCVKNNVRPHVGQCVASLGTTSSQGRAFDQIFYLVMYDQEFQLKCSVTAGALGGGVISGLLHKLASSVQWWKLL